jgi:hypothetical protein
MDNAQLRTAVEEAKLLADRKKALFDRSGELKSRSELQKVVLAQVALARKAQRFLRESVDEANTDALYLYNQLETPLAQLLANFTRQHDFLDRYTITADNKEDFQKLLAVEDSLQSDMSTTCILYMQKKHVEPLFNTAKIAAGIGLILTALSASVQTVNAQQDTSKPAITVQKDAGSIVNVVPDKVMQSFEQLYQRQHGDSLHISAKYYPMAAKAGSGKDELLAQLRFNGYSAPDARRYAELMTTPGLIVLRASAASDSTHGHMNAKYIVFHETFHRAFDELPASEKEEWEFEKSDVLDEVMTDPTKYCTVNGVLDTDCRETILNAHNDSWRHHKYDEFWAHGAQRMKATGYFYTPAIHAVLKAHRQGKTFAELQAVMKRTDELLARASIQ